MPITPFMGVRISCDMKARNSLFLRRGALRLAAGALGGAGQPLPRRHVVLDAEEVAEFPLRPEDGGDVELVDEAGAVAAVVHDFDVERPAFRDRAADRVDMLRVGAAALEETAVAPDHLVGR